MPITSWRAAAQALGLHIETLTRHRRNAGHALVGGKRPWFRDLDELVAWYRTIRPEAPSARGAGGAE